ncbi:MAG: L-2-amino-thiazoline-4-carboxylic acid hydrolase [Desulfatibacillaceae bacterium]
MASVVETPLYDYFFGKCMVYGRPVLERRFGEQRARDIVRRIRTEYRGMLPEVPDLKTLFGRINLMTAVVALPVYRILQEEVSRPEALELSGKFMASCAVRGLDEDMPLTFRMAMRSPRLLPLAVRLLAWWDNLVDDPNGWRFDVLPTPRGHVLALNALRCGVHTFLTAQGAPELTERAICPLDDYMCRACMPENTRLSRTMLLGRGDAYCDFRFISG